MSRAIPKFQAWVIKTKTFVKIDLLWGLPDLGNIRNEVL